MIKPHTYSLSTYQDKIKVKIVFFTQHHTANSRNVRWLTHRVFASTLSPASAQRRKLNSCFQNDCSRRVAWIHYNVAWSSVHACRLELVCVVAINTTLVALLPRGIRSTQKVGKPRMSSQFQLVTDLCSLTNSRRKLTCGITSPS